jgi:hypothetical protein
MAPYVHKYKTELKTKIARLSSTLSDDEINAYIESETYDYVLQQMQNFVF